MPTKPPAKKSRGKPDEQDGAEPLANSRHERFACELAKGSAAGPAYGAAGYKRDDAAASRLSRKYKVKARVDWLKRQAAVSDVLTIAEKRRFIARCVRAAPAAAGMNNPDCELVMSKMGPVALFPSKAALIRLDNDLAGEGAEASGQKALAELVKRLRK